MEHYRYALAVAVWQRKPACESKRHTKAQTMQKLPTGTALTISLNLTCWLSLEWAPAVSIEEAS